jgi:hypothetical protein
MEIKNNKVEVNGVWMDITLEMANKLSPSDTNYEFFDSEADIELLVEEIKLRIADVNNTIASDEDRLKEINNYEALLKLSRS